MDPRPSSGSGFSRHSILSTSGKSTIANAGGGGERAQGSLSTPSHNASTPSPPIINANNIMRNNSSYTLPNSSSPSSSSPITTSRRQQATVSSLTASSSSSHGSMSTSPSSFERMPAPTSTYIAPVSSSPFVFNPGPAPSSQLSSYVHGSTYQNTTSYTHGVKLPRDLLPPRPMAMPRSLSANGVPSLMSNPGASIPMSAMSSSSSSSLPPSSSYVAVTSSTGDLHEIEAAMLADIGYFRERKQSPSATVDALLRDKRETDRLAKSRARDMATINSTLTPTAANEGEGHAIERAVAASKSSKNNNASSSSSSSPLSDMSLISSLTSRLTTLERIATKQAASIGAKDTIISELRWSLRSVEPNPDASLLYQLQKDAASSRQHSAQLQRQVAEMEAFLHDYGLVWVGFRAKAEGAEADEEETKEGSDDGDDASSVAVDDLDSTVSASSVFGAVAYAAASSVPAHRAIYFDVPRFIRCISDLNALATESTSLRIVTNASGVTKFLPPPSLDLVLYKDGMWFRGGPLRHWSLPSAGEFVKDVQEGFYPYELKDEYPDGVCIAIVDRSKECCEKGSELANSPEAPTFHAFAGKGNRLDDGAIVDHASSAESSSPTGLPPSAQLTSSAPAHIGIESFLAKLPASIVRNGKVIEVRGDIRNMLAASAAAAAGSSSSSTPSAPTTVTATSSSSQSSSSSIVKSATTNAPIITHATPAASILIDTPALRLIQARESALAAATSLSLSTASITPRRSSSLSSSPSTSSLPPLVPITTLLIKLDPLDHSAPLMMKMRFSDTVGDVRAIIASHIASHNLASSSTFELRSTYPARKFAKADDAQTMIEAGLTPSANLIVRRGRPQSGYRRSSENKKDESWCTTATTME